MVREARKPLAGVQPRDRAVGHLGEDRLAAGRRVRCTGRSDACRDPQDVRPLQTLDEDGLAFLQHDQVGGLAGTLDHRRHLGARDLAQLDIPR